ncbi:hypothetical protein B566_EDAN004351, partial [Ephemera danica]
MRNFTIYRKDYTEANIACGGVAILASDNWHHEEVTINTTLQAVAMTIYNPNKICICNVYLPPGTPFPTTEFKNLINQLPSPFIIFGDFNAHNPIWGSNHTDQRGKIVEDLITQYDLFIHNSGSATHITMANGTPTMIDLTISSKNIATKLEWEVADDTFGSDHYPILTTMTDNTYDENRNPKWILEKADWTSFSTEAVLKPIEKTEIEKSVTEVTSTIIDVSNSYIPKTSSKPGRPPVPWFNEEVKKAIKERKQALHKCKRRPTAANVENFRLKRAQARRCIRIAKQQTWQKYVSSLNLRTPIKEVWEKVRRIEGNFRNSSIPAIASNGNMITSPKEISNLLAEFFASVSNAKNYNEKFLRIKETKEKIPLDFKTTDKLDYNKPFTKWELLTAIKEAKSSAPGQDQIHIEMIKHLSDSSRTILLELYNAIWTSGIYPSQKFSVRLGNTLSHEMTQEEGMPQGCVLSVSLFNVAINDISANVNNPVKGILYADDFMIFCSSKSLKVAERQIQITVNKLQKWSTQKGFTFSAQKTNVIHFHRLRGIHQNPCIYLENAPIQVVENIKFLGLIFDSKLNWKMHLASIKKKCQAPLNIMRVVSGTNWGADRKVLLQLHKTLVRSIIDYGCPVYSSARESYLRILDSIHNTGLRLATGAFRSTPTISLYAEAAEPPLKTRREELICNYIADLRSKPSHPTYNYIFRPQCKTKFDIQKNSTRPLG